MKRWQFRQHHEIYRDAYALFLWSENEDGSRTPYKLVRQEPIRPGELHAELRDDDFWSETDTRNLLQAIVDEAAKHGIGARDLSQTMEVQRRWLEDMRTLVFKGKPE